jgi:hypothetical protein
MGDIGDITPEKVPGERLIRFRYEAQGRGPHEWDHKYVDGELNPSPAKFAGVMFLDGDWARTASGFDLRGKRVVRWEARSLEGDVYVKFLAGGSNGSGTEGAR